MKIVWGRSIGWNIEYNKARMSYNGAMNFNPAPGMKYMEMTIIKDGADCYPWREVFAWWPRKTITGKKVWWEKVYKRKVWIVWGTGFHMEPAVQYATVFEVLTHGDKDSNI